MKLRVTIVSILTAILLSLTTVTAGSIPDVGYIKPDPVPIWMKQPCGTKNQYGEIVMNCYYNRKTMYQEGDSKHSYYQIRITLHNPDGKDEKMYCFVYWKHTYAKKNNFCVVW